MPEGDTIHYAAQPHPARARRAGCPTRSSLPIRATATTAGPSGWPAARCAPSTRTASTFPALRGRAGAAFAPAHDRRLGRLRSRATLEARAAAGVAGAARRRPRRRAVRRAGARADDRAHAPASTSAWRRSDPTSWRESFDAGALPAPPARGRSHARRSATPCSTSARWPGSATCGRPRRASRPSRSRGAATRPVSDAEALVDRLARSRRACSSPRATASRRGRSDSTTAPAAAAAAAARAIRQRGQGEDNRLTFWCPGCQR